MLSGNGCLSYACQAYGSVAYLNTEVCNGVMSTPMSGESNAELPSVGAATQRKPFKRNVAMRSAIGRLPDMSERSVDRVDMSDRAETRASPNTPSESTSDFAVSWTQCAEQNFCCLFFDNDYVSSKLAADLP